MWTQRGHVGRTGTPTMTRIQTLLSSPQRTDSRPPTVPGDDYRLPGSGYRPNHRNMVAGGAIGGLLGAGFTAYITAGASMEAKIGVGMLAVASMGVFGAIIGSAVGAKPQ